MTTVTRTTTHMTMIEIAAEDVPAFHSLLARERERLAAEAAAKPAPVPKGFAWSKDLRRVAALLSLDGEDVRQVLLAFDGNAEDAVSWCLYRRSLRSPVLPPPRNFHVDFTTWSQTRGAGQNARDLDEMEAAARAATAAVARAERDIIRESMSPRGRAAMRLVREGASTTDCEAVLVAFDDDEAMAGAWIAQQVTRSLPVLPADPNGFRAARA